MPIEASVGILDVENATLRASGLVATSNLAVGRPALKDLNPPTLEIFSEGVPSLELHSNTLNLANSSNAFARFTASAETLVIQSGTSTANDSKGDIAFSGVNDITRYMTIKGSTGRVGIGKTDPGSALDVVGDVEISSILKVGGQPVQPQRRWDIDLTAQDIDNFYPIALEHGTITNISSYFPVNFKVVGKDFGGYNNYNESTLIGYARGGGYSDHEGFCKVHYTRYVQNERRYQGIYEGSQTGYNVIVIYMRGGYTYSLYTDADDVIVNTSAFTRNNATFAIKNQSGDDVVGTGTSANIIELQNIADSIATEQTQTTGGFTVSGNVGIGTTNPSAKLHVHGTIKLGVDGTVIKKQIFKRVSVGNSTTNPYKYGVSFTYGFTASSKAKLVFTATPMNQLDYEDTFNVTINNISTTGAELNVVRSDNTSSGWGQDLIVGVNIVELE